MVCNEILETIRANDDTRVQRIKYKKKKGDEFLGILSRFLRFHGQV